MHKIDKEWEVHFGMEVGEMVEKLATETSATREIV
jgi:hypothetical protein